MPESPFFSPAAPVDAEANIRQSVSAIMHFHSYGKPLPGKVALDDTPAMRAAVTARLEGLKPDNFMQALRRFDAAMSGRTLVTELSRITGTDKTSAEAADAVRGALALTLGPVIPVEPFNGFRPAALPDALQRLDGIARTAARDVDTDLRIATVRSWLRPIAAVPAASWGIAGGPGA